jgi:hypothetical protein
MSYQSSPPGGVVCIGVCRDGICPRDGCPFSPGGVSGACLSLLEQVHLMASDPSLSLLKGRGRGEVEQGCVACSGRRKERSWRTTCTGAWPRSREA